MSEADIEILKAYINAIDTFGTIDYKCINNLYEPVKNVLNELDKKDKVIDKMAKHIGEYGLVCGNCMNVECIGEKQKNCIKKYFYKKVEGENE